MTHRGSLVIGLVLAVAAVGFLALAPAGLAPGAARASSHLDNLFESLGKDLAAFGKQLEQVRSGLQATRKSPRSRRVRIPQKNEADDAFNNRVAEMRKLAGSLARTVGQLQSAYREAKHSEGMKLSRQMAADVGQLKRGIQTLAGFPPTHGMRSALTNLDQVVQRLEQSVARGGDCCERVSPPAATTSRPRTATRRVAHEGLTWRGHTAVAKKGYAWKKVGSSKAALVSASRAGVRAPAVGGTGLIASCNYSCPSGGLCEVEIQGKIIQCRNRGCDRCSLVVETDVTDKPTMQTKP